MVTLVIVAVDKHHWALEVNLMSRGLKVVSLYLCSVLTIALWILLDFLCTLSAVSCDSVSSFPLLRHWAFFLVLLHGPRVLVLDGAMVVADVIVLLPVLKPSGSQYPEVTRLDKPGFSWH